MHTHNHTPILHPPFPKHTHTHTRTHSHTLSHAHTRTHTYTHTCTRTLSYSLTCTYAHTCTHMHTFFLFSFFNCFQQGLRDAFLLNFEDCITNKCVYQFWLTFRTISRTCSELDGAEMVSQIPPQLEVVIHVGCSLPTQQ